MMSKNDILLRLGVIGAVVSGSVYFFLFFSNFEVFYQYVEGVHSLVSYEREQLLENVFFVMTVLPLLGIHAFATIQGFTAPKKASLVVFALVVLMYLLGTVDSFWGWTLTLSAVSQFLFFSVTHFAYIALFSIGLYYAIRSGNMLFKWAILWGIFSRVLFIINGIFSFFLFHHFSEGEIVTQSKEILLYFFDTSLLIQEAPLIISCFLFAMVFLKTIQLNQ